MSHRQMEAIGIQSTLERAILVTWSSTYPPEDFFTSGPPSPCQA